MLKCYPFFLSLIINVRFLPSTPIFNVRIPCLILYFKNLKRIPASTPVFYNKNGSVRKPLGRKKAYNPESLIRIFFEARLFYLNFYYKRYVYVRPCTKYPTHGIKACVAKQGDTNTNSFKIFIFGYLFFAGTVNGLVHMRLDKFYGQQNPTSLCYLPDDNSSSLSTSNSSSESTIEYRRLSPNGIAEIYANIFILVFLANSFFILVRVGAKAMLSDQFIVHD
ncbi:hypothetical protein BpHYR1_005526 [Brachionus plicatilis]|uniref:Uncharacterized protein n=1 Tax=Brachionus plicatilis TaxID=10195 RepID=A0A3M7Q9B0_BRAPC|nr:hypothetical protein BpHYR1_005526 [Brachionus plicatilis]